MWLKGRRCNFIFFIFSHSSWFAPSYSERTGSRSSSTSSPGECRKPWHKSNEEVKTPADQQSQSRGECAAYQRDVATPERGTVKITDGSPLSLVTTPMLSLKENTTSPKKLSPIPLRSKKINPESKIKSERALPPIRGRGTGSTRGIRKRMSSERMSTETPFWELGCMYDVHKCTRYDKED